MNLWGRRRVAGVPPAPAAAGDAAAGPAPPKSPPMLDADRAVWGRARGGVLPATADSWALLVASGAHNLSSVPLALCDS